MYQNQRQKVKKIENQEEAEKVIELINARLGVEIELTHFNEVYQLLNDQTGVYIIMSDIQLGTKRCDQIITHIAEFPEGSQPRLLALMDYNQNLRYKN